MLHQVKPMSDDKQLVSMMANHINKNANKVCRVCCLGVVGHAPESQWLGYEKHDFSPKTATTEEVKHSEYLTGLAYKLRNNGYTR